MSTHRRMKVYLHLLPFTKININLSEKKNLNLKPQTLKLQEENIGTPLQDRDVAMDFQNRTSLPRNSGQQLTSRTL